jgi:hypothetical protein
MHRASFVILRTRSGNFWGWRITYSLRRHLSAGGSACASQSTSRAAHCFDKVVCELQAVAAPGTTEKVVFEDYTLFFGQSTRKVRLDCLFKVGWAAIYRHDVILTDYGLLDKPQKEVIWYKTHRRGSRKMTWVLFQHESAWQSATVFSSRLEGVQVSQSTVAPNSMLRPPQSRMEPMTLGVRPQEERRCGAHANDPPRPS